MQKISYGPRKQQIVLKLPVTMLDELTHVADEYQTTKTHVILSALRHCFTQANPEFLTSNL